MKPLIRGLTTACLIAVAGILLLSLAGYLGHFNYLLDLTSHFKLQYLIATFVALLWLSFVRNKLGIALSLVCIALNLMAIVPWHLPRSQPSSSVPTQPLRVLSVNVNINNQNFEPTLALIRAEQPDVVAIIETNWRWLNAMETVEDILPYSLKTPKAEDFGIALYSKFPLNAESTPDFNTPEHYHLVATVSRLNNQSDQQTVVVALHPPPPRNATLYALRNQELIEVANYIQSLNQPVIVLGDLNITPWSPIYQQFVDRSGLENTRKGFGILPSWPSQFPVFWIPIDHVLVSSQIQVKNTHIGGDVGSDHLPIISDLAY